MPTSNFIKEYYIDSIQKDLGPFSDLPNFTEDSELVFPKGTYTVTNYVADVKNFPPFLRDGIYRIEIFLLRDHVVESGFVIYWKVYPEVG